MGKKVDKAFDGTKVGDRFVYSPHSDVYSYTVEQIVSPKRIVVREDKCDFSVAGLQPNRAKAEYDPRGKIVTLTARLKRSGKYAGEYDWKQAGTSEGRSYRKTDSPFCYQDPSF